MRFVAIHSHDNAMIGLCMIMFQLSLWITIHMSSLVVHANQPMNNSVHYSRSLSAQLVNKFLMVVGAVA